MTRRLSRAIVAAIDASKILGIRAGAVERAYAETYPTHGSLKFVRGFRTKRRRDTTVEFLPREPWT